MIHIPKVLVVDDSSVVREMLSAVMNPHCGEIVTAADCESARRCLAAHPDLTLVLCDVGLPDGSGLDLLEEISDAGGPKPEVIMMTGRLVPEDVERAGQRGAIGYLAKPITFRDVAQVVYRAEGKRRAAPRVRRRPVGRAYLLGTAPRGEPVVAADPRRVWDIRDMSISGAFFETRGPLEVGLLLDLCLDFGESQARVRARTVRVQEPDWGRTGGVGVEFAEFEPGSRNLLVSHLAELSDALP